MTDAQIPVLGQPAEPIEPGQTPNAPTEPTETRSQRVIREILGGSVVVSVLAVVIALVVGSVLIAVTDTGVQAAAGYFFSRPGDLLAAIGKSIGGAYTSLFQGAIYNTGRPDFLGGIKPLTESLTFATPLIAGGLGVALAFRVGLFNIGGQGQILIACAVGGWVGWSFPMPYFLHMLVATLAAMIGGALWAGIAGILKARTGAHEVIVTIMLNSIAFYLITYLLKTPGALQAPGSNNPKSPATDPTAIMPTLTDLLKGFGLGPAQAGSFRVNFGLILVIAATIFVWWLLNRSSTGFRFRAVGENANAARFAGMSVPRVFVLSLAVSGALLGLAGATQVLGTTTSGFSNGVDAGIGFDAITVALLGRSRPWGVFGAGLLFGALKAGGFLMQAAQGVPVDLVLIVQSIIVLFIAAPPLVRTIFRLPTPGAKSRSRVKRVRAEAVKAVTK